MIVLPPLDLPIVDSDGRVSDSFRIFLSDLTNLVNLLEPLTGTGSPEGVTFGEVNQVYIDSSGTAGNIFYVKKLADIGGDTTKGWILA